MTGHAAGLARGTGGWGLPAPPGGAGTRPRSGVGVSETRGCAAVGGAPACSPGQSLARSRRCPGACLPGGREPAGAGGRRRTRRWGGSWARSPGPWVGWVNVPRCPGGKHGSGLSLKGQMPLSQGTSRPDPSPPVPGPSRSCLPGDNAGHRGPLNTCRHLPPGLGGWRPEYRPLWCFRAASPGVRGA